MSDSKNVRPKRQRINDARLLSAVIDFLPTPIWVKDEDSRFVLSNRQHSDMAGFEEEEILGHTVEKFLPAARAQVARERDLDVLRSGVETQSEGVEVFRDGVQRHVLVRKARLDGSDGKHYVLGANYDLTEIRRNEARLRQVTEAVPVGIVQIGSDHTIHFANPLARRLLCGSEAASLAELAAPLAKLAGQRPAFPAACQFETDIELADGRRQHILVRSSGLTPDEISSVETAIVSLVDLTETRELQRINDEISRLNNDLAEKVRMLKEAQDALIRRGRLEQLGQLTATIAHELRNPLGAVRTSVFVLERKLKAANPGTAPQFDRVAKGIVRCDNIITQLLDFARTSKLELREADLDDWLEKLVEEEAARLPGNIRIECILGLGGAKVGFDPARMSRAIINLLSNAAEAMAEQARKNGGSPPSDPCIQIATRQTLRGTEIVVSDNGPGMPAEVIAKIRDPLFTTKSFGTGLGVPAIEKIAEQHGGGLDISSREGEGACFTVWWNAAAISEAA